MHAFVKRKSMAYGSVFCDMSQCGNKLQLTEKPCLKLFDLYLRIYFAHLPSFRMHVGPCSISGLSPRPLVRLSLSPYHHYLLLSASVSDAFFLDATCSLEVKGLLMAESPLQGLLRTEFCWPRPCLFHGLHAAVDVQNLPSITQFHIGSSQL